MSRLKSILIVAMVMIMTFTMECSFVQATEEMVSGVTVDGKLYKLINGKLTIDGHEVDLNESGIIKYGMMNGLLYALVNKDGVEEWVLVDQATGTAAHAVSGNSTNEKAIFNFLVSELGLNTAGACGILANINNESGFNPTASCIDTNGLVSYGICQWNGGRFTKLKNYCASHGMDYTTLGAQLVYLKYELENGEGKGLALARAVPNTADGAYAAAYNWAKYFERCASRFYESRAVLARDVYWPRYSGTSAPAHVDPQIAGSVSGVTGNSARLDYSVVNTSLDVITAVGAELYDASGKLVKSFEESPKNALTIFSGTFETGNILNMGAGYQFRFVLKTAGKTLYSEMYSFNTASAPKALPQETTNITEIGAILHCTVENPSGVAVTFAGVTLYDADGRELKTFGTDISSLQESFSCAFETVTGYGQLKPDTTYKYCFVIRTATDTYKTGMYSFKTAAAAKITAGDAVSLTDTGAVLNYSVANTSGTHVTYVGAQLFDANEFELKNVGINTDHAGAFSGSFDTLTYFGALSAGTNYKYRFYIKTANGTYYSDMRSFKTADKVEEQPVSEVLGAGFNAETETFNVDYSIIVDGQVVVEVYGADGALITALPANVAAGKGTAAFAQASLMLPDVYSIHVYLKGTDGTPLTNATVLNS